MFQYLKKKKKKNTLPDQPQVMKTLYSIHSVLGVMSLKFLSLHFKNRHTLNNYSKLSKNDLTIRVKGIIMHLSPLADLLVFHLVFVGNVQSQIASHPLSLYSQGSSSHKMDGKIKFRNSFTLDANVRFLSLHVIFSLDSVSVLYLFSYEPHHAKTYADAQADLRLCCSHMA